MYATDDAAQLIPTPRHAVTMRFSCINDHGKHGTGCLVLLLPLVVLLTTPTSAAADTIKTLACPDPGSAAIPVDLPTGGTLEVAPAGPSSLCTLSEVFSDPADPSKDVQVIPIARSYDERSWEPVAGFRSEAVFSGGAPYCTSTKCDLVLPAEETNARYVLASYERGPSFGKRDEIARFLDQVTFGVKRSELDAEEDAYDQAASASAWRAQSLQRQMTAAPTSHREWWRKRTSPKMPFVTQNARSDGPCDKNSRWRLYTFTRHDFFKPDDDSTKRVVRFYHLPEEEGLSDPVIYEAEDLILVAPPGQIPLVDTENEQVNGFYGLCEGDCDADDDCDQTNGPRVCFQRSGMEAVPGCYGYGSKGSDYCIDPQELEGDIQLNFTGNPLNPRPGNACEGDCDSDSDCVGDLKCKARSSGGSVLGCYGHEAVDATDDFCYDPNWIPSSWITPKVYGYTLKSDDESGVTFLEHISDPVYGSDASRLEWNITVETAGVYPLSLRFAQPRYTEGDMFVEVTVNDEQVENLLTPYSLGWSNWLYTNYMQATLKAGSNTVRIRNLQEYGARIDHLRVGKAKSTVIEVDGYYRTVVDDQIRYTEGLETNTDGLSIKYSDSSVQHNYEFCDFPAYYSVKYQQGRLRIRPEGSGACDDIDSLNPLVNFAGFENYIPGVLFALPDDLTTPSAWKPAADVQDRYKLRGGYDYILIDGIENNDLCQQVPAAAEEGNSPIFAKLPDGTYIQWSPQLILEDNVAQNPFADGGGDIALANADTRCMNAPRSFLNEGNCVLSDSSTACPAEDRDFPGEGATLVCGSIGEVSNDRSLGQLFDFAHNMEDTTASSELNQQKVKVWTHVAIEAQDQLRQRVAWALSSVFTVVCENIDAEELTEVYLSFFDIFVRHAFGNFKDVLKEASYNPLMATHLTYLGSKSHAYIFAEEDGKQSMADENYAREVMQLFSIGLNLLNADGTSQKDDNGKDIPTYSNEHIMSFARAWTGFQAYSPRGNYEQSSVRSHRNLLDPLHIVADWRDRFPKTDLQGGYIGDGFPLCADLPDRMFLRKGTTYRLLGSNPLPELMIDHPDLQQDESTDIQRMVLESSSNLWAKLYNQGDFKAVVELDQNLICSGNECNVDTVRTVQVASDPVPIYYEYVAQPCVHQAFYEGGKQIARRDRDWEGTMCADPRLPAASEACGRQDNGGRAFRASLYTGERMTYDTAAERCASLSSELPVIPLDDSVGNGQGLDSYGHCQGDCDSDSDCRGNLVCHQRVGNEAVPGCSSSMSVEPLPVIPLDNCVGNGEGESAYGHCQGDCDRDSDCVGDLKCFQRDGDEDVPGCSSTASLDPLLYAPKQLDDSVGNGMGPCDYDHCQGDCDRDDDCIGPLKCFQRSGDEDVPGCIASELSETYGTRGWDYCYLPENPTFGTYGTDYCYQPTTINFGSAGTDYCVDPYHESGAFKFGMVTGSDHELGYHWSSFDCVVQAKINNEGRVALVHETDNMGTVPPHVNAETTLNYFNVYWNGDGGFPSPDTGCGTCRLSTNEDACICPTQVVDEIVFDLEPNSVDEILQNLYIGAVTPDISDSGSFTSLSPTNKEFTVHFPQGSSGVYTPNTVFELKHPYHGANVYLKNTKSTVTLKGWEHPTVVLEGEDATIGGSAVYVRANETSRQAFTGAGYMQFDGAGEGTLDWTISVPNATTALVSFRFENTMSDSSPVEISVNSAGGVVELESTGVYENWIQSDPIQISLNEGSNTIQLKHSSGITSYTKIDSLKIEWDTGDTGTSSSFRNAPHFMGLSKDYGNKGQGETAPRDAHYETEAVLDHYFHHSNVAPFICTRLIQRHGVSNPSPFHVGACSEAFRSGTYTSGDVVFGSSEYGSLEATMAAIALEPEAASSVLDVDTGYGHLRENYLKPIQLLRSLEAEFTPEVYHFDLRPLIGLLGQEPHHFATVFSWFRPEYQADVGPSVAAGYVSPESMIVNMPTISAQLNGLNGLVKYGVSDCSERLGFGEDTGYGSCYDDGSMQAASSFLSYSPAATDTAGLVQELNTLLCAGRLSPDRQSKIVAALDGYSPAFDETGAKLRFAYQLIISTPEFHTNTVVKDGESSRPGLSDTSSAPSNDYKAVVLLYLSGGVDSFNMLPPLDCQDNLYEEYAKIRGGLSNTTENPGIALPKDTLWNIPTNNDNHVCSSVGLHPNLPFLKELYDVDQALFVCNAGLMQFPANKDNYDDIGVPLFSHNSMSKETKRIDLDDKISGTGILGRMRDKLSEAGYSTNAFSIAGSQPATIGTPGVTRASISLSPSGLQKLLPRENDDDLTPDLLPYILSLNNATSIDSPFMSETWSAKVSDAIYQQEALEDILQGASVTTEFPSHRLCDQLETVAKVMSTHQERGADRDLFYVSYGGWDTHSNVIARMEEKFDNVNTCLSAFVQELNTTGLWESTVLAQFSEFGRTLDPNSGPNDDGTEKGADHAWGGNHFVIGGSLKGGQVLGQYPSDFTDAGPLALRRGRIIPTTPWDSTWNAIAPWAGVPAADLDYVLPMKKNFDDSVLFTEAELFTSTPSAPTETPPMSPTQSPSQAPTTGAPTTSPTSNPTKAPSSSLPSSSPTMSSDKPSASPSVRSSSSPSMSSDKPSARPSVVTSSSPTMSSDKPSVSPSVRSSGSPTATHSASPTGSPTTSPTGNPTASPTKGPTTSPSASPSNSPTATHSALPTGTPTASPTTGPTTALPTKAPTTSPSASPSNAPTVAHSALPTGTPTASPTKGPTNSPTDSPTDVPTLAPNAEPAWETIGFNGFEKGDGSGDCSFNGWLDGGADSRFINNNWNNVHSGNCALRLQDDSDTSTATSELLPVVNYDTLKVTFWYKPRRMTASSEEFHLYISKDGGDFALEHTWSSDGKLGSTEFTDGIYQQGIVDNIVVTNASNVRIQFICNGDTNQDRVFIDDVAMEAM